MKNLFLSAIAGVALLAGTTAPVAAADTTHKIHKHTRRHKTAKRVGVGAAGGAAVGAIAGGAPGAAVGAAAGAGAGAVYDHEKKKQGK